MHWVRQMFADGDSSRSPKEQLLQRLRADGGLTDDAVRAIEAVPREKLARAPLAA